MRPDSFYNCVLQIKEEKIFCKLCTKSQEKSVIYTMRTQMTVLTLPWNYIILFIQSILMLH